jgi:transcriptional regulator
MHPNAHFRWNDEAAVRGFVADIAFGTLFAYTPDGPRVAHVPVVVDGDRLLLHVANGNGITRHLDGADVLFVVTGPDAYISPDWYGLGPDQVPTWNYIAVECEGRATRLDRAGLMAQIDALSADQEARLAPKPAWTRDKMDTGIADRMMGAITAFAIDVTAWRTTAKLSQNKPQAARLATADALEAQGRKAVAHLMRNPPQ